MKIVSSDFIKMSNRLTGSTPVARSNVYMKYPGVITYVGSPAFVAGITTTQVKVYGNATKFFYLSDTVIIKSLPLSSVGAVEQTPTFDGTNTSLHLSGLSILSDSIGGYVLRNIDFKFTVGST